MAAIIAAVTATAAAVDISIFSATRIVLGFLPTPLVDDIPIARQPRLFTPRYRRVKVAVGKSILGDSGGTFRVVVAGFLLLLIIDMLYTTAAAAARLLLLLRVEEK